jgi:AcrR family transcriptional regulator
MVYTLRASREVDHEEPSDDLTAVASRPGAGRRRRERLSRERVIRAAVVLADRDGIESFSMRSLANELGVVPMALYKHVSGKEDLLDEMVDIVLGEVERPTGSAWRKSLRGRAISLREALLRHPWAIGLVEVGTPGPAALLHREAVMACLRDKAGLSFPMALHATSLMDSYIYGFAHQERSLTLEGPAEVGTRLEKAARRIEPDAKEYPHLTEMLAEIGRSGYNFSGEFEFGLDVLLDGIEGLRRPSAR